MNKKTFEEWIEIVTPYELDKLKSNKEFKFCKNNIYKHFGVSQKMLKKVIEHHNYFIKPLTRSKALTTEEFIKKASLKHDNKYDYSLVVYKNNRTKIDIICSKHGIFKQKPNAHSDRGDGCPKCGLESRAYLARTPKEEFIEKSRKIHNYKFDYSLVHDFKRKDEKVTIICPKHGEFYQTPTAHIQYDCEKCSYEKRGVDYSISKEELIEKFKLFNNGLEYDLKDYVHTNSIISYVCSIHGKVHQKVSKHLKTKQCKKCVKRKSWNTGNTDKFIKRATEVHGDTYDYSKTSYKNNRSKVEIICKHHGSFFQRPNTHVDSGGGCQTCAKIITSRRNKLTKEEIESSKNIKCILYVIELYNDKERFWKIGISSSYKIRKREIERESGYKVKDIYVLTWNVFDCFGLEQHLLRKYNKYKHKPLNSFRGQTECFYINPHENFKEFETLNYKIGNSYADVH